MLNKLNINIFNFIKSINLIKLSIYLTIFLGILIASLQFDFNRSLWLDEAMLSLNIIDRSAIELLLPLKYNQVAPILFLQIEKFFTLLFPNTEFGLRIFVLICFISSIYFFYQIIKILFDNQIIILFCLVLFVFNKQIIYFSSEVKQYMCDTLTILLLYFVLLKNFKKQSTRYKLLLILGCISIFLSNIAPIILSGMAAYMIFSSMNSANENKISVFYILSAWFITFVFYYFYFVHGHPTKDFMVEWWSERNAFMPFDLFSPSIYNFAVDKYSMVFFNLLNFSERLRFIPLLFLFLGAVRLIIDKKFKILILIFSPITLHLLLSSQKIYPFDLRLILYTIPTFIIIISIGIDAAFNKIFSRFHYKYIGFICLLIPITFSYYFIRNFFPLEREEIKESIIFIQRHIQPDENIYVYYSAKHAFKYYKEIKFATMNTEVIYGTKNREDIQKYMDELKLLKDRTWILFSHPYKDEENYILGQLDSLGYQKLNSFKTVGSSAYLYDFKN